jgi:glutamate racemase
MEAAGGAARPIGVFDSGVGGLSVVREIRRVLPGEHVVYVADTAHCPYGDRPAAEVRTRALALGRYLEQSGAKLVVVACNTATGVALEDVRRNVSVPVVGLEPAVKTAAAISRNGRIGVMATSNTLASERFSRLVREHASGLTVVPQACPGLVEMIEAGRLDGPALEARVAELARPLAAAGVDTVVLGCTHYPFAWSAFAATLGPTVTLVDTAPAIARRTVFLLQQNGFAAAEGAGSLRVLTTGDPRQVGPIVRRLWGGEVAVEALAV